MPKRTHADDDDEDLVGGTDGLKGHNSGGAAGAQLRSIIERIERVEEEQKALADDKKEIYAEAKGNGFDTKAIRKLVSERKQDANERLEFESILDLYRHALGMVTHED